MLNRTNKHNAAGLLASLLLSLPSILPGQQIAVGAYYVPTPHSNPQGITAGPDAALWFTEIRANQIGRITPAGAITEYAVPTPNSNPDGVTGGPDGALWFTEYAGDKIGRITTAGIITEYTVPTALSAPDGITVGPDGALWFTEYGAGKIGRITTAGVITEFTVPVSSAPSGIAAGPDGALWFAQDGNTIGRITTSGMFSQYTIPTFFGTPVAITAGPDGAMWFTESYGNSIGRITTGGAITEYPVPTVNSSPNGITLGPDGALWFTEYNAGQIGRITTAGVITEYPAPAVYGDVGITTGPDRELWFTEGTLESKIGEAVFVTANLGVNPTSGSYNTKLTFTGSGFAANEIVKIYVGGVGSTVLARGTADAAGSFTVSAREPQAAYGQRLFLGLGQTSGKLGAATFSVTARLVLNPTSGPVGTPATAQGYGFGGGEMVNVYWPNPKTLLGTVTASRSGTTGALTFTVPVGAPAGVNKVYGVGQTTGARGYGNFTVN